jgi:hypothetical protein
MGFSYNADGSHDTYVFRNGNLFDNHYEALAPMPQPQGVEPLLHDKN